MKFALFLSALAGLAKAGLWVAVGILINKHFETFITFLVRKPLTDDLVTHEKKRYAYEVIRWVGIFVILVGLFQAILAIYSLFAGMNMHNVNFNFR